LITVLDALILEAVARSSMRSAAAVHRKMKRGMNSLATIASAAPLLGFIGTVVGIPTAFIGCGGEKSICQAAVVERISTALVPAALGLLVAISALCFYRYCCNCVNVIDLQMKSVSIELVNYLVLHLRRRGA
jgi:biopolymer transport protein ExbB/TolQ